MWIEKVVIDRGLDMQDVIEICPIDHAFKAHGSLIGWTLWSKAKPKICANKCECNKCERKKVCTVSDIKLIGLLDKCLTCKYKYLCIFLVLNEE